MFNINGLLTQLKVSMNTRTARGGIMGFVGWFELWIPPHRLPVINCVLLYMAEEFSRRPRTLLDLWCCYITSGLISGQFSYCVSWWLIVQQTSFSLLCVSREKIQPDINLSSNLILLTFSFPCVVYCRGGCHGHY